MADPKLDEMDRRLVNLAQSQFPLGEQPFAALGASLGMDGDEVISRLRRLKDENIVRLIGPVVDAGRLGYRTTLAGLSLAADRLDEAGRAIAAHPLVSHCYEREHRFNLWFTLAAPEGVELDYELHRLVAPLGARAAISLPALRVFKLGVHFDMLDGNAAETVTAPAVNSAQKKLNLSPQDRAVLNELQQDLPLEEAPFSAMAARAGMPLQDFLAGCRLLLDAGVIRRYGASVNHRRAGYEANAMTCWKVSAGQVDNAGLELAAMRQVSHCYERKTDALWPYNLFAMFHGRSRQECRKPAEDMTRQLGLGSPVLLFSTKEIKKERVRYLL